jgi:hypothetical protein
MKTIRYGDSKDFYRTLHATIVSGEPAAVETEFTSMSDTPKRVRDVFRLDEVADPTWVDSFTGKFIPGAKVPRPTKPDLRMVIALATAAIGAGAGGLAAGPIGAAAGAIVGAGVGAVAAVLNQEKVRAHIEIDLNGKLIIKVEPK